MLSNALVPTAASATAGGRPPASRTAIRAATVAPTEAGPIGASSADPRAAPPMASSRVSTTTAADQANPAYQRPGTSTATISATGAPAAAASTAVRLG